MKNKFKFVKQEGSCSDNGCSWYKIYFKDIEVGELYVTETYPEKYYRLQIKVDGYKSLVKYPHTITEAKVIANYYFLDKGEIND